MQASRPLETIRSGFQRFYEFSKTHPEYFALMFVDRPVPQISRDWDRFGFVREMKETMATVSRPSSMPAVFRRAPGATRSSGS